MSNLLSKFCKVYSDDSWKIDQADGTLPPLSYVVASDGFYEIIKADPYVCVSKVTQPTSVKNPPPPLGFSLTHGKIPLSILSQVVSFFKSIYNLHKSEASAHIMWSKTSNEYFVYVPTQTNGAASSHYDIMTDSDFQEVLKTSVWVVTCHSHASMSAFFSATDDADEKKRRVVAMVVGNLDATPTFKFRYSTFSTFVDLDISDVFDTGYNLDVPIPSAWLAKCTPAKSVPVIMDHDSDYPKLPAYGPMLDYDVPFVPTSSKGKHDRSSKPSQYSWIPKHPLNDNSSKCGDDDSISFLPRK